MQARALSIEGAVEFTPTVFADDRGLFVSPLERAAFEEAVGHGLFPVAQTSHSKSRRGVVRGVHFTLLPPGTAKYVTCTRGRALDMVVDIRPGSPTFGRCEAVVLDEERPRAIYLPVGVGHAFAALEDDTVMTYLLSESYVAENERALSVTDPALALPLPAGLEPILSERDVKAPTLEEARVAGLLPEYTACLRRERELCPPPGTDRPGGA